MVNHVCVRCGYTTNRKQNLKNHLLRKFICEPINEDIDRYNLLIMNNFDKEANNYICNTNVNLNVKPIVNLIIKKKYICLYCKKEFTTRQGKYKHMKLHCKEKNDEKDIIIAELKNNVEELKKTVEQLILNQGKNTVQPKLNNGTINNVGNVKNMKNKTNIQINNYGCENIDYITDKVFKKLLNTPMSAIQKLIEYKHFHPDHPENHNVKITNIHDKYAKIYKDKKWLVKHKKDIVEDLVENGYADFEEFKNLNEDQLAEKVKEKFEMMQKKFNNNFEGICKSSELSIINGSNP